MSRILAEFRAGRVRRWHTNPWLCHTVDTVADHGARCKHIIKGRYPAASQELLHMATIHDFGEYVTGDVGGPTKDAHPELRAMLERIEKEAREAIFGPDPELSAIEQRWLKFADRLDPYIWARHHRAPMDRDGWPAAMCWLYGESCALGVDAEWTALVKGME